MSAPSRLLLLALVAVCVLPATADGRQSRGDATMVAAASGTSGATGPSGAVGTAPVQGGTPESPAPVVGGGSFGTAPTLTNGTYRDTVVPAENLFYAVELKAGQQLRLRAQLDTDPDSFNETGVASVNPVFYSPLREVLRLETETGAGASSTITGSSSVDLTLSRAETLREAGNDGVNYLGPGTWYLGFTGLFVRSGDPPKSEVPIRFTIEVTGQPVAEEAETFPDAPKPAASPKPAQREAEPAPADAEGGHLARNVAIGLVAALLGAGLGVLLGRARPPRTA